MHVGKSVEHFIIVVIWCWTETFADL